MITQSKRKTITNYNSNIIIQQQHQQQQHLPIRSTMTLNKKPLFRKPKKRKLSTKKRIITDDDHENENDNVKVENNSIKQEGGEEINETTNHIINNDTHQESSVFDKIQSIKKNRKLKSFIRTQTKLEKQKLLKLNNNNDDDDEKVEEEEEANKDLKERLDSSFASTKLKSKRFYNDDEDDEDDEDGGIMRKKHKLAMEQYIQSQMSNNNNSNNNESVNINGTVDNTSIIRDKKDLYAQLLKSTEASNSSSLSPSQTNQNSNRDDIQEGDVGAGGEMLGGTGIAEVILSVEDRIKNVQETEMALAKKQEMYQQQRKEKGDDLSAVGSSYAHNFRLHNSEWIENKKKEGRAIHEATMSATGTVGRNNLNDEYELNNERIGFYAKRGLTNENDNGQGGGGSGGGRHNQSKDDKVWKNFVRKVKR
jgi:hypothetical protein